MSKNKQPTMAFTRKPCVIATGLALSLMAAQSVYAQQAAAPADAAQKAEKIEVTGTRIPPPNLEGASPVTVIDAQTIQVDGLRSVENLLNNLPQVFAAQGANVANGATGTAQVNLRGLGATRTLVLVNGRRLPYGSVNTAAADLNQIPAPLIKRVEILTGGAGAVYGSDAVSGVVNFIMNDKFEGVQVELNQSFYNHKQQGEAGVADIVAGRAKTNPANFNVPGNKSSDGRIYDASFLMGSNFAGGKGNATVYFGYKKEDALLQSERDFSACSLNAGNAPGSTAVPAGQTRAGIFSCGGSSTSATGRFFVDSGASFTAADAAGNSRPFNAGLDQYNFGPANHYQRPSERYSANVFANYDLFDFAKVYSEFAFTDYNSIAQIAPGGLFGVTYSVSPDNPLLTPSWRTNIFGSANPPAGTAPADVTLLRRNVEGGGRQSDFRNTSYRTVLGSKGEIGNWSYDVFMQTSKVVYQQAEKNYFSTTRGQRALDVVNVNGVAVCRSVVDGSDPACIPYNPYRIGGVTDAQLAYLATPGLRSGSSQQMIQGGTLSSDLGNYGLRLPLAKNGIGVAFGVERRTEKLNLITDSATQSGDLSGSGGPTPGLTGKFTVEDIFAEVRVPIIEGKQLAELLSVTASYRNSDYSTNIKTNTYGVGVEWAPIKTLRARGSYQEAVRAANLIELFTAQGNNLFDMDFDPCGPSRTATAAQCARTGVTAAQYGAAILDSPAGQYNFLQGGNQRLSPEKAKSATVGLVFTPWNNLSASIDYFDIKVDNTIGIVLPSTTLNQCLLTGSATFCSLINRDNRGTLWLNDAGRIVGTNVNIGGSGTSGYDLALNYNMKLNGGWGQLGLTVQATLLKRLETEEIKGLGRFDCVGLYGNKCGTPNPEWRNKTRLSWASPWGVDLAMTWRYMSEVKLDTTSGNPLLTGSVLSVNEKLSARNYFDLAAAWQATKQITLRAGINNVLDKDPPITAVSGPSIFGNGNTFPQVYDALGRRVFLTATAKF